jgi:hypothetical protein
VLKPTHTSSSSSFKRPICHGNSHIKGKEKKEKKRNNKNVFLS